jgi:hypothetical protein
MQPIEGTLFSPFEKKIRRFKPSLQLLPEYEDILQWERLDATVNKVRASPGYPIKNFRQLVDEVANVTLSNRNYEMYYRGQNHDYKNNQATYYKERIPKTVINPTICRPNKNSDGTYKYSIKSSQVQERYNELAKMIELLSKKRSNFNEFYYSLLQHYNILPTPLIDITQSLRVAATFALLNSTKGYLYVFGLPYPNQSISFFSDLGIVLIKLQNVSPESALRPRYQEGYLVGKFPIIAKKTRGDDLANRLVAKFLLDNSKGDFWDKYFLPMPTEILYPENDTFEKNLLRLKVEFDKKYNRKK